MIRDCVAGDFEAIYEIINDAAQAYRGIIPPDCWHDPYMPREELREEITAGVAFLGYVRDGELAGVMGTQDVQDVTLIRHAYVRTGQRNQGIGGELLAKIMDGATRPVLIGTWADAVWRPVFTHATVSKWSRPKRRNGCCGSIGTCRTVRSKRRWCWPAKRGSPPDRIQAYYVPQTFVARTVRSEWP